MEPSQDDEVLRSFPPMVRPIAPVAQPAAATSVTANDELQECETRIAKLQAVEKELVRRLNAMKLKAGATPKPPSPRISASAPLLASPVMPERSFQHTDDVEAQRNPNGWTDVATIVPQFVTMGVPAGTLIAPLEGATMYTLCGQSETAACENAIGDLVQVQPGLRFVDKDGLEHFCAGDIGTVTTFRRAYGTKNRRLGMLWERTQQISVIGQGSWPYLNFIRTQKPKADDLLQALPGSDLFEKADTDAFKAGDVGKCIKFCNGVSQGKAGVTANFSILWARTEKITIVKPESWMWYRPLIKPMPQVGDFLQAMPGMVFATEDGEHPCSAGDIGRVLSFHEANNTQKASFKVRWDRTEKISNFPNDPWICLFRLIRVQRHQQFHSSEQHLTDAPGTVR
jgi:hypothetical protein